MKIQDIVEKVKFECSSLCKVFNKGLGKEHKKESLLMRLKIIENKNKKQLNEIEYQIKKQLDMIDSNREKQFKTIKETRQASKTCCTKKRLLLEKIEKEEK